MKKITEQRKRQLAERALPESLFVIIVALLLVVNVILFILTEAFDLYLYEPYSDDLTISGNTDTLFEKAIEEGRRVKISFCLDEDTLSKHNTGAYVYETAKEFKKRYPEFIELEYINILTRRNSKGELVSLSKYTKDMEGNPQNLFKSSVIFESGSNYRVVTDSYTDTGYVDFYTLNANMEVTSYNGEEVMASMISWVLKKEHKTAYFTQYHGEVSDISFSNLLISAGYNVKVIDLKKEEVPSDAGLVVISNPTADFERAYEGSGVRAEIDRLNTYLENGGNLFVALDPYVKTLPTLEAFLAEHGISFSYTTDKNGRALRNLVKDIENAITTDGFTLVTEYSDSPLAEKIKGKVEKYTDGDVIIREACALSLSGAAKPLLISSDTSSIEAGGEKIDTDGGYCVGAYSEAGDGNVFVVPSIYLAVSDSLVTNGYSNKEMIFALLEELYGADSMPYGCKITSYDTSTLENLTMGTAIRYTVFFMSIPAVIALCGAVVVIRRKYK